VDEHVLFHGHPSWLATPGLYVRGAFAALLAGVIGGLASAVAASSGRVQPLWVVVAVSLAFLRTGLKSMTRRARTTYTLTDRRLIIRVGLVSRRVQETYLEQVLNVKARQTVLERLLGIGTVDFDTAAGAAYEPALRGVTAPAEIARAVRLLIRC
jgi:uncharacterized membrane protein YdbT with pleckstrin-like domain